MMVTDYFAMFDLPRAFALDADELERRYLRLQTCLHPDRHAQTSATEQRLAVELSARFNEAYRNLRDPLERAVHLLALHEIDVLAHAAPVAADFLQQQMSWHEDLSQARLAGDQGRLAQLQARFRQEQTRLLQMLTAALDQHADYATAAALTRQLMFLHRLIEQAQIQPEWC